MLFRGIAAAIVGAAALATTATTPVNAQPGRVQVGTLACSISAGVGLLVASQRNVSCNFQPNNGPPEAYTGTITRVGVDVGFTTGGAMVWGVFAGTNRYAGMLAGTYAGASAEATLAAGLGANVLVGGSNQSVALQPLSVQGQVGLNIAAGIGALDLHLAQ
jgi:Protein of unknown function (DUF992)